MKRFALSLLLGACGSEVDLQTALLAHYPFDGDAADASPAKHDGTISACSAAPDRFDHPAGALRFDDASSVVSVSNVELVPPYTVGLWIELEDGAPAGAGCEGGRLASLIFAGYRFALALSADRRSILYVTEGGDMMPIDVPASGWHHLTLVDRGFSGSIWVDAQLARSDALPEERRHASFLTFGGHPAQPCGLRGALDDAWIFLRDLSADDIAALHALGDAAKVTGP